MDEGGRHATCHARIEENRVPLGKATCSAHLNLFQQPRGTVLTRTDVSLGALRLTESLHPGRSVCAA